MKKKPKVIFVIGGQGFGKSTFIKKYLMPSDKKVQVIDLWDFQKKNKQILYFNNIDTLLLSYKECLNALLEVVNSNKYDIVILEHTLLKRKRRPMYIEPLLELGIKPEVICMYPEFNVIKQRWIKRDIYIDDDEINYLLDTMELPTCQEGFSKVIIINEGEDDING